MIFDGSFIIPRCASSKFDIRRPSQVCFAFSLPPRSLPHASCLPPPSAMLLLIAAAFFNIACAANVLAPNISACNEPIGVPYAEEHYRCCAPVPSYEPQLFRPPVPSAGDIIRVRRTSHSADDKYASKLARAYSLMKELPAEDPRSFVQQANIHCAYCNSVYSQMNSSERFQAHHSWLFFPFHRWYLYFHERILAKLLGDDTFSLTFWNYDHPNSTDIPWLYSAALSPYFALCTALRDASIDHPSSTAALDYSIDTDARSRNVQLSENDNVMYRSLIRDATTAEEFFGFPLRPGETQMSQMGAGTVELKPHNTVHGWLGNKSSVGWKDMGTFYAAANDPLFYAHHAQLDRLWEVWKSIPGHVEFDDADYANAEFLFYNEEGEMVRVKAGDASNTTKLGYVYEDVETPWMEAVPQKRSLAPATLTEENKICEVGEWFVDTPCSFTLDRDPDRSKSSPWLHEYLELTMQYNTTDIQLNIFLNYPSANATTDTGCEEYVTDYALTRYSLMYQDMLAESFEGSKTDKMDITRRLAALGLTEEKQVVVTIVPRLPLPPASPGTTAFLSASLVYTSPYESRNEVSSM
ncbi:hypothetical protein KP509_03G057800 [Ceratopteris richardii]|uniref:Tyrosinase copper-binding domain-containing protein n=1 Tax=Ceratopteris richardii TaxID=49495 RepID=A0A8T2V7I1_CERRI|nr:hypothetical protein KP509_03G057800 [Ceratopteris richardii]